MKSMDVGQQFLSAAAYVAALLMFKYGVVEECTPSDVADVQRREEKDVLCVEIFLPSMDSPVSTPRMTASLQTTKVIFNDVILNTIDLTVNDADVTTTIQHYHVTGSTQDPSVTLLTESLLTWLCERGTVLGPFVNIASRLQDDSRVDVISNMRRLHSTLGGPPFSQEDVRRCLKFAQGHLQSLGLYAYL